MQTSWCREEEEEDKGKEKEKKKKKKKKNFFSTQQKQQMTDAYDLKIATTTVWTVYKRQCSTLTVTIKKKTTKFMSNILEAIIKLKFKNSKNHFYNLVLYLPA